MNTRTNQRCRGRCNSSTTLSVLSRSREVELTTSFRTCTLPRSPTAYFCITCKCLYLSSIQSFNCFCRQRFARAAKIADFNAKDLAAPEPERTRAHFSAFINLVKFSEQRADFIKDLRSKSASINRERVDVTRRLSETQAEVAAIR